MTRTPLAPPSPAASTARLPVAGVVVFGRRASVFAAALSAALGVRSVEHRRLGVQLRNTAGVERAADGELLRCDPAAAFDAVASELGSAERLLVGWGAGLVAAVEPTLTVWLAGVSESVADLPETLRPIARTASLMVRGERPGLPAALAAEVAHALRA